MIVRSTNSGFIIIKVELEGRESANFSTLDASDALGQTTMTNFGQQGKGRKTSNTLVPCLAP